MSEDLTNRTIDNKYKLRKMLGEGGMGSVWLATHRGTGRPVALKLIVPHLMDNKEFLIRFQREAQAAGRLRHLNIVDVTDFGFADTDGQGRVAYLVMEYLQGAPLSAVLKEEKHLPLSWTMDIFEQVCLAVDYAHRHGVIHRDLKPDNIWLTTNDRGGFTVKVLDFGLARLERGADDEDDDLLSFTENAGSSTAAEDRQSNSGISSNSAKREVLHEVLSETIAVDVENGLSSVEYDSDSATIFGRETLVIANENYQGATIVDETSSAAFLTTSPQPAPDLTQAGNVMGTPTYMSPEQCRGERVGIESDIYSLGVIAYEMMGGRLPFTGSTFEIIKDHILTAPTPLRQHNKSVPRQVARVVMSALAKSPDERPPNGEAFASMLRAAHDSPLRLLQRAFVIYSEFFPKLLLASIILGLPALLIEVVLLLIDEFLPSAVKDTALDRILIELRLVWGFFEFPLLMALMMRLVAQFTLSPLKPLRLREAFSAVQKRLAPLLLAAVLIALPALPGTLFLPAASWLIVGATALTFPVVMVEGLDGWAALWRGLSLARRAWAALLVATSVQFGLPLLIEQVFAVEASSISGGHHWEGNVARDIDDLIGLGLGIFLMPLVTTMLALVYLKARQMGGEPAEDILAPFETEENLYSDWQSRLHSSLKLNSLIKSVNSTNKSNQSSRYAAPSLRSEHNHSKKASAD